MDSGPIVHPGAQEHYADAKSYEARYAGRTEDVSYYLGQARSARTVLEYGAGAGRLTLPLCRRGLSVVAVDTSDPMLQLLKLRLLDLPRSERRLVTPVVGDMRTYSTRRRFDLVLAAFHTVCHLYSVADLRDFLRRALSHLRPGGRLLFDLPLPRIDMPGYDPIAQVRVTEMEGPTGPQLLTQRWYQPREISMHLHYAGFSRIRVGADFSSQPLSSETSVMTVSAVRPKSHSAATSHRARPPSSRRRKS